MVDREASMTIEATTSAAAAAPPALDPRRAGLHPDGSVETGRVALPYSDYASAQARQAFVEVINPPPAEIVADVLALRAHYARQNQRLVERMHELFAATVREDRLGGVRVHRVTPAKPRPEHDGRVLLALHGGAFAWGADSGALVEAIPIAAQMGAEVIAVDYRLAPEHRHPAGVEDVAAVYRTLLETYAAEAIGLYGCSAGGVLTAQAVAWFAANGLPRPGAVAILGAGGGEMLGDAGYLAPSLEGYAATGAPLRLSALEYFAGVSPEDPCVCPGDHPEVLRGFPPTLLIAGGRDFALSSATNMHLRLDAAGIDARLYVFDGLWHAFQIFPDLPESRRVYEILATFFGRTLAG
jgi:monoterpene epsilon-lactone hydrolase